MRDTSVSVCASRSKLRLREHRVVLSLLVCTSAASVAVSQTEAVARAGLQQFKTAQPISANLFGAFFAKTPTESPSRAERPHRSIAWYSACGAESKDPGGLLLPMLLGAFQPLGPHHVPVTIKCGSQQILLSGFGGRKASSSMGKISTAEVLRLRAPKAVSRDKSARRIAQDDDSVGKLTERGPLCGSRGAQQVPRLPPDFLSNTVASVDFMRLSLRRAASVAAGRAVK
jgi:hypothetical protein